MRADAHLMVGLYLSASARDAAEGRSAFGSTAGPRLGERLCGQPLTLRSNPAEPGLECTPFLVVRASSGLRSVFDNGLPLRRTTWIRQGVLSALVSTRHSAALTGLPLRPPMGNLLLEHADDASAPLLDDLIRRTRRGLLLTSLAVPA